MVLLPKNLNKIKMPMANVLILDYSSDAKEAERILTHTAGIELQNVVLSNPGLRKQDYFPVTH